MPDAFGEGPLVHLKEHPELILEDLALVRAHLPAGASILDIGAGRGSFVSEARRGGLRALGLDMQVEATQLWGRTGVSGVVGDGTKTPFRGASFDVVRMKEVIEHIQDPLSLVREARRILKPGGLLLAHVPTTYSQFYPVGNFWDDYTHVRPFSRVGLQRLFADAGLDVLSIEGYTSGRNAAERALGKVLGRVFPHIYRILARR